MAFGIPQLLGYAGNEIRYFDELWGGRNEWRNLSHLQLWDLFAIRYPIAPAAARNADSIPGFRRLLASAPTSAGPSADSFGPTQTAPYPRARPRGFEADPAPALP